MLVVTVNRTIALIKCKIPEFNTEIKVQYHCHSPTKRWKLVYKNDNFTCRMLQTIVMRNIPFDCLFFLADEDYPSTIVPMERSPPTRKPTTTQGTDIQILQSMNFIHCL